MSNVISLNTGPRRRDHNYDPVAEFKNRFDALLNDLYAEVEPDQEILILKGMVASMLGYVEQQIPGDPAIILNG